MKVHVRFVANIARNVDEINQNLSLNYIMQLSGWETRDLTKNYGYIRAVSTKMFHKLEDVNNFRKNNWK